MSQDKHATIATCRCCGDRFIPEDGPCCLECEECGEVSESVTMADDGRDLCPDCTPEPEPVCEECGEPGYCSCCAADDERKRRKEEPGT